jgi:hypothetical protein
MSNTYRIDVDFAVWDDVVNTKNLSHYWRHMPLAGIMALEESGAFAKDTVSFFVKIRSKNQIFV